MLIFLTLLAAVALATFIHLAGMVVAAQIMRVRIDIVSFGGGPTLAIWDAGNMTLRLAAFPVVGHVRFVDRDYDLRRGRMFDDLSRTQQLVITLAGCIACLLAAVMLLGPLAGLRETAATWAEFFGVLGKPFPFTDVQWAAIAETARSLDFVTLAALACAKYAGLNLLPLAPFNGGTALMILLGWRSQQAIETPLFGLYFKSSLLIVGVLTLFWLIGGISFAGWGA
jgi:hypothetical protein